jgi:hypothetical protein
MAQDRPDERAQNLERFRLVIRRMLDIANAECIVSSQLMEVLVRLIKALEKINADYKVAVKKSRLIPPQILEKTMNELKTISDSISIPGAAPVTVGRASP